MNPFRKLLERLFPPPYQPLPAGIHHYQSAPEAGFPYRLHLRLENNGEGVLIVNASTVLHLNQTAAEMAYHLVKQTPPEEAVRQIAGRYRVSRQQIAQDFESLKQRLETLISTPDLDPVTYLGFERHEPYSQLTAPYRLDCALTYRTPSAPSIHDTLQKRVKRELVTEEWQTILSKGWQAGIPHIIFTGGEPTLRPDLIDLVAYAESLGQVTGLLTDGSRLTEKDYLHHLLQSGLDHMMIILDPSEEQGWEAIRDTLAEDILLTVHLTLTPREKEKIAEYIKKLAKMGVQSLSISASDPDLKSELNLARQIAADQGMSLVWDLPVPYSGTNPIALELEESGETPQGAGHAWLYVEPDGDVLPGQGMQKVLGNLLTDDWEKIWSSR